MAPSTAVRSTLAALTTLTMSLAGCSMVGQPEDPRVAVTQLAQGLSSGDLGSVPLSGAGSEAAGPFVKDAYAGMGTLRPKVDVVQVTTGKDETTATATLHTTWDVSSDPQDWTYDTSVKLALTDGAWRVQWSPTLVAPDLTTQERLSIVRKWPRRADIVDRAGAPLVTEREVALVGIDKTKVAATGVEASATALATLLGIDAPAYTKRVTNAGPQAFVQALMLRADDPVMTTKHAAITAIPGAVAISQLVPLGPTKTFAQPILGAVGEASADTVAKSNGVLTAGDEVGLSGLEAQYDTRLRGTPGLSVRATARDAGGNFLDRRELFAQDPKGVPALAVTLDSAAQGAAEKALAGVTTMPAALVAVKASTGEVIAAAISPGAKNANLALAGNNAPGSTFKIVTSLAILRKGATPATTLPCTNTLNVGGRLFKNYTDYPAAHVGTIPLYTALAFSCNTAFISQHSSVSQDDLIAAAAGLGVGTEPTLGFPNFMGSVPAAGSETEHAATMIGQGKVEMSPLAMATVVASVLAGHRVSPVLVRDAQQTNPEPPVPLTAGEAQQLREALSHVVSEGSGHRLQAVGVQYAKTGTAEYGTEVPPKTHAWMVAGRGDLAIAAYVQDGASGTSSAGPLISDFLTRIGSSY